MNEQIWVFLSGDRISYLDFLLEKFEPWAVASGLGNLLVWDLCNHQTRRIQRYFRIRYSRVSFPHLFSGVVFEKLILFNPLRVLYFDSGLSLMLTGIRGSRPNEWHLALLLPSNIAHIKLHIVT